MRRRQPPIRKRPDAHDPIRAEPVASQDLVDRTPARERGRHVRTAGVRPVRAAVAGVGTHRTLVTTEPRTCWVGDDIPPRRTATRDVPRLANAAFDHGKLSPAGLK